MTRNNASLIFKSILVYILACVAVGVSSYFIQKYFGEAPRSVGVVSTLVTAIYSGGLFYKQNTRLPTSSEAWRTSATMTTIIILASLLPLYAILGRDVFSIVSPTVALMVLIIFGLIHLCGYRFCMMMGAKSQLKAFGHGM